MDFISIIVPVHNNADTLERCVSSILEQTYTNIELILISNGCNDESDTLCEKYLKKDNRVKHINISEAGVSRARNAGLKSASGQYIGFVDADDYVEKDMYEKMFSAAEKNNADICVCGYMTHVGDTSSPIGSDKGNTNSNLEYLLYLFQADFTEGFVWNKLYRKDVICEKMFDEKLAICEDLVFNAFIAEDCSSEKKLLTVTYVSDALYHYIASENSATGTKKQHINDTFIYSPAFNKLFEKFKDSTILPHICRKYHDILRYSRYCLLQRLNAANNTPSDKKELIDELKKLTKTYKSSLPYIYKAKLPKRQLLSFGLIAMLPVSISVKIACCIHRSS